VAVEPTVRLSDTERENVVTRLSDALSEGRLDLEDFRARLDAAYVAKTHGEIAPLTADLPTPRRTTISRRRRWRHRYGNYVSINALVWGIWGVQVLTGGSVHDVWPIWVTIPTTALLIW
jgi:hypothetical protein